MGDHNDVNGFVAGWFGGCAGLVASHPLDTVRIRMQTHGDKYSSAIQCFVNVVKQEKVKGLFKGMTYPFVGQGAINATVFGVEIMMYKRLQKEGNPSQSVENSMIAGCFAGAVQTVIVCPMELVKIRMQNQSIGKQHISWTTRQMGTIKLIVPQDKLFMGYMGPLEMTGDIICKEGWKGMYKGWWLTLIREAPQFGIYFGTYEWLKLKFASLSGVSPNDLGVFYLSLAGGLTGVVTWCWYPVDVIKSRFQADFDQRYSGIVDCTRKSVRSEGIKVFVKGIKPTLMRGFVNGCATLPVVTLVMKFLSKDNSC